MGLGLGFVLLSLLFNPGGPPLAPGDPDPLERGERALFSGRFGEARAQLRGFEPADEAERQRRARLLFEVAVAEGDRSEAERWAATLSGKAGWGPRLERGFRSLERLERRMFWARAGVFTFALAFGVLLLGAGRELLRPRRGVLLAAAFGAAGVLLARAEDPGLGLRLGMCVIGGVGLLHAAEAAIERQAPTPKWRVMLATAVLAGTLGIAVAAFAP